MGTRPGSFRDRFQEETYAHFATLLPDGRFHNSPVWIDYDTDRDRLLVNSGRGRRKVRNVENDPRVSLSLTDPDQGVAEEYTGDRDDSDLRRLQFEYEG